MSELDDAIARLEAAVARLEAATDPARRPAENERAADATAEIAGRIDAALAKLAQLLEWED
jgi:tetrahydromethanopterin S-methyltransferase subunit B